MTDRTTDLGPCQICGRRMISGASVDDHHWVPKSRGGKDATTLHRVCHRMIHRLYSEKELVGELATPEGLRAQPEVAAFIKWVRKQPEEYVDWPKWPRRRRSR